MLSECLRDSAMSALILGFFASTWLGWAQERPPAGWRGPLIVGSIVSILVAVAGGVLAWRNWFGPSALDEPGAMTRFGIIVGIEFGLAALGAAVLAVRGRSAYTAVWICLVVGVHFWPLAPLLADPSLLVLGAVAPRAWRGARRRRAGWACRSPPHHSRGERDRWRRGRYGAAHRGRRCVAQGALLGRIVTPRSRHG
jgi:hypothetical protein